MVLVLSGAAFAYVFATCLLYFLSSPTLHQRMFSPHGLTGPIAVTICNSNPFR